MADRMVGGTERTIANERRPGGELVGDRINARHVQRFFDAHLGQDTGQGARQQSFSASRNAHHKYVMDERPYTFQWSFHIN